MNWLVSLCSRVVEWDRSRQDREFDRQRLIAENDWLWKQIDHLTDELCKARGISTEDRSA